MNIFTRFNQQTRLRFAQLVTQISLLACSLLINNLVLATTPIRTEAWYQQNTIANLQQLDDSINFVVIGDWGRNGHYQQQAVANQMDNLMYWLDGDFIISTGDNFYPNGISSVNDPYLQTSFEQVYSGPNLFEPWYLTLGNHDYRGSVLAQIAYTKISQRWNLPERYYSKTFKLENQGDIASNNNQILIVFLDTSPFEADYQTNDKYISVRSQNAEEQLNWMEQQLSSSHAKWKLVVGHHPMYSSGKRFGKTESIRQTLEDRLEAHQVDAYIAGHEHDLQHNKVKGKQLHHFISGAGATTRPVKNRSFTRFAKAESGVMAVSVNSQKLLVQMVNAQGQVIYKTELTAQNK
ncbi:acid phosphatase [Catenovulum maritimum]|uniref:acid phosphatase n=2 Tax=Catenovulum maritimum TaxID=1513271 RepID=A0A0J8GXZ9_9ALTE|nr:acid phosphatase [Catenovulum maritimum]